MRRSTPTVLLIALALLGHLLAPFAAEARSPDPFANFPICTHDGGPTNVGGGSPTQEHTLCDMACCHLASVLLPPVAQHVVRNTIWTLAFPPARRDREPSIRVVGAHRARGPPLS